MCIYIYIERERDRERDNYTSVDRSIYLSICRPVVRAVEPDVELFLIEDLHADVVYVCMYVYIYIYTYIYI